MADEPYHLDIRYDLSLHEDGISTVIAAEADGTRWRVRIRNNDRLDQFRFPTAYARNAAADRCCEFLPVGIAVLRREDLDPQPTGEPTP